MRAHATKEKPTEEGMYLWWELDSVEPCEILATVIENEVLEVNFYGVSTPTPPEYVPLKDVADRLWLKVSGFEDR